MAGYYVAATLSWGWIQSVELVLAWFCSIGMLLFQQISMCTLRETERHTKDRMYQLNEAEARWKSGKMTNEEFEAFLLKIRQERLQEQLQYT